MPQLIQASFFWQNNRPGGIGITFGPPRFSPQELTMMFEGPVIKNYMRDTDKALGSNVVNDILGQLRTIGEQAQVNGNMSQRQAVLAALNIMWLSSRGFIPNDNFNGPQFIHQQTA